MKERITRRTLLLAEGCTASAHTPPHVGRGATVPARMSWSPLCRHRTEVRVLYDGQALYVGDLDLRTGYVYEISAAGVQGDDNLFDDVRDDRSRDAVCERGGRRVGSKRGTWRFPVIGWRT
ncbi:MAG TPA: hypothetical protein VHG35_11055 [Gemmatimonadales bacterium]|nr:hypothetical protein [Gemmatimonadales bacterium]